MQTNEVSRALAWLWPAALAGCGEGRRPLAIVDVGASAGLNLSADLLSLSWRKRSGGSLSAASSFELRARVGFDPRPLDAGRTEDRAWLRACVWPGQLDRLRRLDAAIGAFQRATPAPEITLLRAASVPHRLPALSERVGSGGLVLVYQTLVRGYLPSEEREVYEGAMLAWLQQGRRGERAWVTLELEDEHDPELNCPIDVQVATGGASESIRLGCTGYHPEVVDVDAKAEQRLVELLRV